MKSRNIKVIDEHNIDRNANVVFAFDLEGSEYVVYWIERDEESNNIFVSKLLKNIDGTSSLLNIDDDDKKREIADMVKTLISTAVSDQNDKMVGTSLTLSNGEVIKFIDVLFNKEQYINVPKTYITTVKKEVTKVAENYYDVVVEEAKVEPVLPSVAPVAEPVVEIFPEPVVPSVTAEPVSTPSVASIPVNVTPTVQTPVNVEQAVVSAPVNVAIPQMESSVTQTIPQPAPVIVEPTPVVQQPQVQVTPIISEPVAQPTPVIPAQIVPEPVQMATPPVVESPMAAAPVQEQNPALIFNASKETNLNAALGEVANSTTIPVDNISPIREFGVEEPTIMPAPIVSPVVETPVTSTPLGQSVEQTSVGSAPVSPKAGFANSKFFMVVAVAFFLASCVFLGYEVYNYFQLVK